MISLKSLIPEIKIIPNFREPKPGDVYYNYIDGELYSECDFLLDKGNEYLFKIHLITDEDNRWDRTVKWSKESVMDSIRNGEMKLKK